MATKRTQAAPASGRAAAVRAAQAVTARRAKALEEREQQIAAVLTDFFQAASQGGSIRTSARTRAARLLETAQLKASKLVSDAQAAGRSLAQQADAEAADCDAQVAAAVRRLLDLGESRSSVGDMTGLPLAEVRALEHHSPRPSDSPAHIEEDQIRSGSGAELKPAPE